MLETYKKLLSINIETIKHLKSDIESLEHVNEHIIEEIKRLEC